MQPLMIQLTNCEGGICARITKKIAVVLMIRLSLIILRI
jgi:hypothetical protein